MRQEWEKGCNFAYQSRFMPKASVSLLAALLTLCSCATQYDIAGNSSLDDVDGHMLYLRVAGSGMDSGECSIDSCKVVHGRFRFGGVVDSIVLAQVFVGNDAMLPVVIEDGELQISMGLAGPTVEGGQLNKRLYDFLKKLDRLQNELWEAENACIRAIRNDKSHFAEARERLKKRSAKLNRQIEEAEIDFVTDNFNNALGPGYYIMLCNRQLFPTMTEQLRRIADRAPRSFFSNPYINSYLQAAGYSPAKTRRRGAKR